MKKFLIISIACLSLVVTVYNIVHALLTNVAVNYWQLSTIVPVLIIFYSESKVIYRNINKLYSFALGKTVGFETSYKFDTESDNKAIDYLNYLSESLADRNVSILKRSVDRQSDGNRVNFRTESENGIINDYTLVTSTNSEFMNSKVELFVKYQISYRDVRKSWIEFRSILESSFSGVGKILNSQRYSVKIYSKKDKAFNPFYRLIVKNIDPKNIEIFELKYTERKMSITTSANCIYAVSPELSDINSIIAEYIPLTSLYWVHQVLEW